MDMSVKPPVNAVYMGNKKSNAGTKIGAGVGLALGSAWVYMANKGVDKFISEKIPQMTKANRKIAMVLSAVLGVALVTGLGALIGKGVQKVAQYIISKKQSSVIKTKNGEFKVENGHPKTIFRKNPQTREWERMYQVYDGSWGKEVPNEVLVGQTVYL